MYFNINAILLCLPGADKMYMQRRPGVAEASEGCGGRAGVSPYRKAERLYDSRLVPRWARLARPEGYAGCSEGAGSPLLLQKIHGRKIIVKLGLILLAFLPIYVVE